MALPPELISSVVSNYFDATCALDQDARVDCSPGDATSYDPYAGPVIQGHDELRQFYEGLCAAFVSIGLTQDSVLEAGDKAAVKFTGRGTGKNGRSVVFEVIDVLLVDSSGNKRTMWGYWDPAAMVAELQSREPS